MEPNSSVVKAHKRSYNLEFKLRVIEHAEKTTNAHACDKFNVTRQSVQDWRRNKIKIEASLMTARGGKRKRIEGAGTKLKSQNMEEELTEWILDKRGRGLLVSRSNIQTEARRLYPTCDDVSDSAFKGSNGWLQKFLIRNNFSLRRQTTVAQKDPNELNEKIVSFIAYTCRLREKHSIENKNIIAMDETSVFFDMGSKTTVDTKGVRTVTIKTTGHDKNHVTVVLAARGDGVKLKPYIVFKNAIRDVKKMQKIERAFIVSNSKGWMDDPLTADWLDKVVVKQPDFDQPKTRLLVWDAFRCHISDSTKAHLLDFNCKSAVIPGGCTKYIQAPDVSWNRPFKVHITNKYNEWMQDENNMDYTKGGNLRAAPRSLIVEWVIQAWDLISTDIILNSFKTCALTIDPKGGEDEAIHCLKFGQPCRGAWQLLQDYRDNDSDSVIQVVEEVDNGELYEIDYSDED